MSNLNNSLNNLNSQVDDTKQVLLNNCDKIIERDNRLSNLEYKTNELTSLSIGFKRQSRNLKNKMWWQDKMCWIIVTIIIIIIIIIIVVSKKN